jgi:hypothetical protein
MTCRSMNFIDLLPRMDFMSPLYEITSPYVTLLIVSSYFQYFEVRIIWIFILYFIQGHLKLTISQGELNASLDAERRVMKNRR